MSPDENSAKINEKRKHDGRTFAGNKCPPCCAFAGKFNPRIFNPTYGNFSCEVNLESPKIVPQIASP